MLKVEFSDAKVRVKGHWTSEGSVFAGTIDSTCHAIEVEVEVESDEEPARVAALVRNAKGGCYAESLIKEAVPISGSVLLNGEELDYEAYPQRVQRR